MTCAMRLNDPCDDGEVLLCPLKLKGQAGSPVVPLCDKHELAFLLCAGPFATWTRQEREKWAKWAADRAARQEAKEVAP